MIDLEVGIEYIFLGCCVKLVRHAGTGKKFNFLD